MVRAQPSQVIPLTLSATGSGVETLALIVMADLVHSYALEGM